MSSIISTTITNYMNTFDSFSNQFLIWGKEIFFVSLGITIVWMCLWNAFDKSSFNESMASYLKEFVIITIFFTVMIYANEYLKSVADTAKIIGAKLCNANIDPSALIDQGSALANKILSIPHKKGLLDALFSAVVLGIIYLIINLAFIAVAIEVAVTKLTIYFFISIASFLLAFCVFPFTRQIARKTIDIVFSNTMKLTAIYILIAAGNHIFTDIAKLVDNPTKNDVFTVCSWAIAATYLFLTLIKTIPNIMGNLFSNIAQGNSGVASAAAAVGGSMYLGAKKAFSEIKATLGNAAKISSSTAKIATLSQKQNQIKNSADWNKEKSSVPQNQQATMTEKEASKEKTSFQDFPQNHQKNDSNIKNICDPLI